MSTNECCLCHKTSCSNYKIIQKETGEYTEIYDITVKYFDPIMLITDGEYDHTTIRMLCKKCWSHIDDFHEFQQSVLSSRLLSSEVIPMHLDAKLEESEEEAFDFLLEDTSNEKEFVGTISEETTVDINIERNTEEETAGISLAEELEINEQAFSTHVVEDNNEDSSKVKPNKRRKANTRTIPESVVASGRKCSPRVLKNKATKDPNRAVYTLEKGRELDNFIAQWKPNLDCDLCPVTATNFDMLRSHFREVHKSRFYIKCCDRKFYRRCILVDHIRLHVNPDTHKCDICGKSSTSKYNLKLHKKIVHNEEREYECEICHKNFNHKPTLERHLLTHVRGNNEFFCKQCGKGYVLEVQLNTHMRNVHNTVQICHQCGKTLHSVGAFKKHLIEHGIIPQPKFRCDECAVELKSNEALKRHKAAYHHDGTTVYVCSVCGKVAASEHALLSHKKFVHEGNRKHKCNFCEKAFRTPIVLREHIATHTGEDLYQCPHCPQTFKTNANMHHHRKRVHPKEWKEARKNRLNLPKVNVDQLRRQVVI